MLHIYLIYNTVIALKLYKGVCGLAQFLVVPAFLFVVFAFDRWSIYTSSSDLSGRYNVVKDVFMSLKGLFAQREKVSFVSRRYSRPSRHEGRQAFAYLAPSLWNSVDLDLHIPAVIETSRKDLKIYL